MRGRHDDVPGIDRIRIPVCTRGVQPRVFFK